MDDKDAPAFVGAVWPRDIIEKYKEWHRRTQPWAYEKGVHLQLDGPGPYPIMLWLRDDERISLERYRRLLPASRQKLKPHQLPEDLDASEGNASPAEPRT